MEEKIMWRWLFAVMVTIVSESISYPTDTVKRKMMMQSGQKGVHFKSTFDCVQQIYEHEGIQGFWKGNFSNIIRSFGSALCLVIFDEFQKYYQRN